MAEYSGIDYGAGRGMRGAYENLSKALSGQYAAQNQLAEAENEKRRREIADEGLFGTGIKASHLNQLAQAGLKVAEFGETRMQNKMDRATEAYDRRREEMNDQVKYLEANPSKKNRQRLKMMRVQMGTERDRYEDKLEEYGSKGMWGTGFGSEGVGYKGMEEGKESAMLQLEKRLAQEEERESSIPRMSSAELAEQEQDEGESGFMPPPGEESNYRQPVIPRMSAEEIGEQEEYEQAGMESSVPMGLAPPSKLGLGQGMDDVDMPYNPIRTIKQNNPIRTKKQNWVRPTLSSLHPRIQNTNMPEQTLGILGLPKPHTPRYGPFNYTGNPDDLPTR